MHIDYDVLEALVLVAQAAAVAEHVGSDADERGDLYQNAEDARASLDEIQLQELEDLVYDFQLSYL